MPVGQAGSSTQVVAAATSVALGQPVTLTATVAAVAPGTAAATGTVSFFDGGTLLGSAPLLGGQAVFTTTRLGVGSHLADGDVRRQRQSGRQHRAGGGGGGHAGHADGGGVASAQDVRPKQLDHAGRGRQRAGGAASGSVTFIRQRLPGGHRPAE